MAPFMRVNIYTNSDIKGVELSAALKNARAALIRRRVAEVSTLGISMVCSTHTFYGLAGMGDMIVTCTSQHSLNNRLH